MKVTEIREEENEKSLLDDYEFMTEEDMKAANFSECLKKMFHNWVLVKYSHNCWNDWSCFQLGVIHVYFSLPPLFQPCQLNASSSGNVSRVSSNFAKADPVSRGLMSFSGKKVLPHSMLINSFPTPNQEVWLWRFYDVLDTSHDFWSEQALWRHTLGSINFPMLLKSVLHEVPCLPSYNYIIFHLQWYCAIFFKVPYIFSQIFHLEGQNSPKIQPLEKSPWWRCHVSVGNL